MAFRAMTNGLSAVALLFLGIQSAHAHRPYFTQVERLVLPNGQAGEIRLLKGDGIFGPDPVRVLILDNEGRLVARSHRSLSIAFSCRSGSGCKIFDLADNTILDLEPSTFRLGPLVPGVQNHERDQLWELEAGDDAWGFRTRRASVTERIEGNWAKLSAAPIPFYLVVVVGVLGGFAGFVGRRRPDSRLGRRAFLRIIEVCVRILLIGLCLVLSFALAAVGDLTIGLWLSALALGAAGAFVLVRSVSTPSNWLRPASN